MKAGAETSSALWRCDGGSVEELNGVNSSTMGRTQSECSVQCRGVVGMEIIEKKPRLVSEPGSVLQNVESALSWGRPVD